VIALRTLWHYLRTRQLHFPDRATLQAHQQRQLRHFARRVMPRSPYFSAFAQQPFDAWPSMDKALMMAHFDRMNTAGLKRDTVLACARRSEADRDFSPMVGRFSVGLSSGTSGQRGLFVASPRERAIWAGGMLARALPDGLFAGERVALFLRADNTLYHSVNNRWLSLRFYDLFAPFDAECERLARQNPSIVVAPAQVLRALAQGVLAGTVHIAPKKVISVAEVLDAADRALLKRVFPEIGEIYQATEGFLAATCPRGVLHLNEEFLVVEPQWIDEHRFTPQITDFTRHTQPIVRYRLDDVLVRRAEPCDCGRAGMALAAIEGRHDDQLVLAGHDGTPRRIFADLCARIIANALPLEADYRLVQRGDHALELMSDCDPAILEHCRDQLTQQFAQQDVDIARLIWRLTCQPIPVTLDRKRRRIQRTA
jgi:putative adenylate-forming enzyme